MARLLDVILHDQRAVLTICCRIESVPEFAGVTFALPHLVDGGGALATIPPPLDDGERAVAAAQRVRPARRDRLASAGWWQLIDAGIVMMLLGQDAPAARDDRISDLARLLQRAVGRSLEVAPRSLRGAG